MISATRWEPLGGVAYGSMAEVLYKYMHKSYEVIDTKTTVFPPDDTLSSTIL